MKGKYNYTISKQKEVSSKELEEINYILNIFKKFDNETNNRLDYFNGELSDIKIEIKITYKNE